MGTAREDNEGRSAAVSHDCEFFGAPSVGIVRIRRDLGAADVMSVGMSLQKLSLASAARSVDTCVDVSTPARRRCTLTG
jgi:hypothetical protein